MIKHTFVFVLILCMLPAFVLAQEPADDFKHSKVNFHFTFLGGVQKEAKEEHDDFFFLYFYEPGTAGHALMDSLYFGGEELSTYIENNYGALAMSTAKPQTVAMADIAMDYHEGPYPDYPFIALYREEIFKAWVVPPFESPLELIEHMDSFKKKTLAAE